MLELYKAPLRVEGWCESLIETTRLRRDQAQGDLPAYLHDARHLPALLLTGEGFGGRGAWGPARHLPALQLRGFHWIHWIEG